MEVFLIVYVTLVFRLKMVRVFQRCFVEDQTNDHSEKFFELIYVERSKSGNRRNVLDATLTFDTPSFDELICSLSRD